MVWVNDIIQGILLGGLYALFAAGLSLVFGVMRLVNLAHGDFSIMAAYISLAIVGSLDINPFYTIVLVMLVMGAFGYVVQRGLFNYAMDAGPMQAILATFGIAIIIQNLLLEGFTANSKGLDAGSIENAVIKISDQVTIGWFPLITIIAAVIVLLALQLFLGRTRMGRAFRATADNQTGRSTHGHRQPPSVRHGHGLRAGHRGHRRGVHRHPYDLHSQRRSAATDLRLRGGDHRRSGLAVGDLVGGIVLGIAQVMGDHTQQGWGMLVGHLVFLAILAFRPQGLFAKQAQ